MISPTPPHPVAAPSATARRQRPAVLDLDWTMAAAVWHRNLTVYRRTWTLNILPNFFEPVLYLVGMGVGLGAYVESGLGDGASYLAWIAPGLMAAAAMNGATFETTYNVFIKMNFAHLYDPMLATPAQMQDIALGELLWATTRAMVYGGAFLVVLLLLQAAGLATVQSPAIVLAIPVIALTGAMFGVIGLLFTAYIRTIDLYSYFYTLFLTPLFLFSGIFYPVDRFPAGETIAWFTPLYHAVELTRALAHGNLHTGLLGHVLWMLVVTGVGFVLIPSRMQRILGR